MGFTGVVTMTRGKVLSFDRVKGYGFVAPDTGGDDVFIHVNDLHSDKDLLTPGSIVEFLLEEGDRGPKASAITVINSAAGPTQSAAPQRSSAYSSHQASDAAESDAEGMADVLSAEEFAHECTEALLRVEPELTSRQIIDIRKRLSRICQDHGWLDH